MSDLDPNLLRADFPALEQSVHGKPLVYLDSAATAQKPRSVIDATSRFYERDNANVHRGVHALSERATRLYEGSRKAVRRFLNAQSEKEIVFVRGTTEAVNLVAHSFVRPRLSPGDEVLVTELEHHSNLVPWQLLCRERNATLRVLPVDDSGELRLDALDRLLSPRTRLLSVTHVSNALGTVNPIATIVERAHARGVPVFVDGAQAAPHLAIDVQKLGCDFYAFSGHKTFGPTGIGALYGRLELLEAMPPYQGGGDMILSVTFETATFNRPPQRFEAGTPNIAGAVGLTAAIEYLEKVGLAAIEKHDAELVSYGREVLSKVPGLKLVGSPERQLGAISFVMADIHPHDIGTIVDREGVAIRAGHHCAQPLLKRLGHDSTARASLALYNRKEDLDALARALHRVREVFT